MNKYSSGTVFTVNKKKLKDAVLVLNRFGFNDASLINELLYKIRGLLKNYHLSEHIRQTPTPSQEKKLINDAINLTNKMYQLTSFKGLPPITDALLAELYYQHNNLDFFDFNQKLNDMLLHYLALLNAVKNSKSFTNWTRPKGNAKKEHQSQLYAGLEKLFNKYGLNITTSRDLAMDILPIFGFEAGTGDARDFRKIARRGQQ